MKSNVQLNHVSHHFSSPAGSVEVLRDIDLEISGGEMVGVHGASGSGKTTLMLICGTMLRPSDGNVSINETAVYELSSVSRSRFRGRKIGFLFQTLQLVPYLSLRENIQMAFGSTAEDAMSLMKRLGLVDRADHKPEAVSHGQRQRAALARALAHCPEVIVADEPTGNLDEDNANLVFEVLKEFAEQGGTVLVASHDPLIERFADRCYNLVDGALKG